MHFKKVVELAGAAAVGAAITAATILASGSNDEEQTTHGCPRSGRQPDTSQTSGVQVYEAVYRSCYEPPSQTGTQGLRFEEVVAKGGHSKGARPSTKEKHQKADARRQREQERARQRRGGRNKFSDGLPDVTWRADGGVTINLFRGRAGNFMITLPPPGSGDIIV